MMGCALAVKHSLHRQITGPMATGIVHAAVLLRTEEPKLRSSRTQLENAGFQSIRVTSSLKRILITGASGFLGSKIVESALAAGWHVRALYRSPGKSIEGVEAFLGDIGDRTVLRRASEGVSAIVHAAGLAHLCGPASLDSTRFDLVNELGTGEVAGAAVEAGVPHVVLVSSVSVYGRYPGSRCDESVPCNPQGPYAVSHWRGELKTAERIAQGPGHLTILRFVTAYGEGDRGNVARLIGTLDRGRFVWPGSGLNQKSLIHRQDAARACICAVENPVSGNHIFNVSARPASMREIVLAICQALGRPVPSLRIPSAMIGASCAVSRRIGDPMEFGRRLQKFTQDNVYDGSKFETAFGFRPVIELSEGLRREVEWLRGRAAR